MTLDITADIVSICLAAVALFYVGRDTFWLFRPQSSPGMRGLANGWDEGYGQAFRDVESTELPTTNPYRKGSA